MINKMLCIKHTGNMLHSCINNYTATYIKHNFNSVIYHLSCNKFSFLLGIWILNNISVRTHYMYELVYQYQITFCLWIASSKIIIPTYILFFSFMQWIMCVSFKTIYRSIDSARYNIVVKNKRCQEETR